MIELSEKLPGVIARELSTTSGEMTEKNVSLWIHALSQFDRQNREVKVIVQATLTPERGLIVQRAASAIQRVLSEVLSPGASSSVSIFLNEAAHSAS